MMKVISKKDMGARADRASMMAPTIGDRLRQAKELVHSHPIDESLSASPPAAPVPTSLSPVKVSAPAVNPISGALKTPAGAHFEMVNIELIDQNPFNARKIYRTESVNDLAASISTHGQEIPGIATVRDGRYVLVAGHYRLRALKLVGIPAMALMVQESLTDRQLYAHSYRENAEREGQSALDNALAWRDLLDKGIYASETELAETTGLSLSNVNKTMSVLRLSPAVLDIVREDPSVFPFTLLYDLVLFEATAGQAKAVTMARQIAVGDISRRDLQAARAQLEVPSMRKSKETSRQYKIKVDGRQTGFIKEWDSGKIVLEVQLSDPKERQALLDELKARFHLPDAP